MKLLWFACLVGCSPAATSASSSAPGEPAAVEPAALASAPVDATPYDPALASEAERRSRALWFPHELAAVDAEFGGDWQAFYDAKLAREAALDAAWEDHRDYRFDYRLSSAEAVRAMRMLHEEWEVARADEAAVTVEAQRVLLALARGDFEAAVADCVGYSAADRVARCLAALEARRAEITAAVRGIDAATLGSAGRWFTDQDEAGMTGQVVIAFGDAARAPANAERDELYPETWQIELWWSGQVMPEANGPRHAHPLEPGQPAGRWRFYDVIAPYSREPTYRN